MTGASLPHPSPEARLADRARQQCSAFSRAQALDLGMSGSTIHRRVRAGIWTNPHPGVYTIAGSSPSWLQEVWTAYLAIGPSAVVSHETALHIHGVHLGPRRPITLTVRHGGHSRLSGLFVHQIDDLLPHRISRAGPGLPVSVPERAVVEVASTLGARRLGMVVDEAVAAKLTSYVAVGLCLREVARRGKPGVGKLARLLDERSEGAVPPASRLEAAMFAALKRAGLPAPRRQFPLPGRGSIEGLVDAAFPDARLIVEADGRRWHTRMQDLKRDHQRDTEAARAGWQTLRFVYEEIMSDPGGVAAAVADVLHQRTRRAS